MSRIEKIDVESFRDWQNNPVTKQIIKLLDREREIVTEDLQQEAVLLGSQVVIASLYGFKRGLSMFLDIEVDEVIPEEDEDETSDTSGGT